MSELNRTRRTNWSLLFGRRKSSNPPNAGWSRSERSELVAFSRNDLEPLYANAAKDRHEAFESAQRRYEFDFIQAEISRWKLEHARDEVFQKFLDEVREQFMKSQEMRLPRRSVFTEAMARRESDFRSAHDERATKGTWYANKRAQALEQGRKRREAFYEAKREREKRVRKRLEERREALRVAREAVKEHPEETIERTTHTLDPNAREAELIPPPSVQRGLPDHFGPPITDVQIGIELPSSRPHSPSSIIHSVYSTLIETYSPVIPLRRDLDSESIASFPVAVPPPPDAPLTGDPFYPTIIPPPSFPSSHMRTPPPVIIHPRCSSADSSLKQRESRVEQHEVKQSNPQFTKREREKSWIVDLMDLQEALFMETEREHLLIHNRNIEHWDNTFRSAEERRNSRTLERETLFEELQRDLEENMFKPTLRHLKQQCERSEEARRMAEKKRADEFSSAREYYQELFERAQASYRAEYDAASHNEKEHMTQHQLRVRHLIVDLTNALESLRSYFGDIFTKDMRRYKRQIRSIKPRSPPSEWGSGSARREISLSRSTCSRPGFMVCCSEPGGPAVIVPPPACVPAHWPAPYSCRIPLLEEREARSPSRMSWLRPGDMNLKPEAGFIPQTLFQSNGFTRLPIPQDHISNSETKQVSRTLTDTKTRFSHTAQLERHKNTYERAAAQREADVELLKRKHQEEFAIGDARRQLEFLEMHKMLKYSAAARERRQAETFNELLRSQETLFEEGENQRADAFLSAEREREEQFRQSQKTCDEYFNKLQSTLLKEALEEESKRERELCMWRVTVERDVREKRLQWEESFEEDEEKRRETFEKLLGVS
ncbi:hypothetical protein K474DRAFT_1156383 [Panus rudis PR-1116 ss-1]|nr:hypothetical protein K474DRAFT_1156383 [Panus rudis PR-1116 ss-1]